jgi:hypothetical protein
MIIPNDAIIAEEKVRNYLLVAKPKGDQSQFLATAGYKREDFWELLRDLRNLLPAEATLQMETEFGRKYSFRANLNGPNGKSISVRTIWEDNRIDGWKFITLIPERRRS